MATMLGATDAAYKKKALRFNQLFSGNPLNPFSPPGIFRRQTARPHTGDRPLKTLSNALVIALAATLSLSCGGGRGASEQAPSPQGEPLVAPGQNWPVKTREHVDLWLHGFAMLTSDTTQVPFFRRGYRDQMVVFKNRANVTTLLDSNRDSLQARFRRNPNLVSGQFLALHFATWDEMRTFINFALLAEGDPRRAQSREGAQATQIIAGYFPAPADREWLRRFTLSLEDESSKYYHAYWVQAQREREPALRVTDSLWQNVYRPKLQRFLSNTRQVSGDLVLSLPLDGEGRTITGSSERANIMAVSFPSRPDSAAEVAYLVAHEAVGGLAASVIRDNITPAEQRQGVDQRYQTAGAVLGGLLLMEKSAPELADGYARYYLRASGATPGSNPRAELAARFQLPTALRDALARQMDIVMGGI
jgi:hypothetical protein